MRGALVLALLMSSLPARAGDRDARTRELYDEGERAYRQEHFQSAYDAFRHAYLLSKEPALLYDMATALERLSRPHDAAEELRAYLRARPQAPGRAEVESRIRGLEEAQRLIDAELIRSKPPALEAPQPRPRWTRRRVATVVTLSVLGGLAAAAITTVGVVYGTPGYSASTFGVHRATP